MGLTSMDKDIKTLMEEFKKRQKRRKSKPKTKKGKGKKKR